MKINFIQGCFLFFPLSFLPGLKPFLSMPLGVHCVYSIKYRQLPLGDAGNPAKAARVLTRSVLAARCPGCASQLSAPGPRMRARRGKGSGRGPATVSPAPEPPTGPFCSPGLPGLQRGPESPGTAPQGRGWAAARPGPAPPPPGGSGGPSFRRPFRSAGRPLPAGRWARVA